MAAATTITEGPMSFTDLRLLRLMQLVSPTLPVGAFAYSQGLEWAVDTGRVTDIHAVDPCNVTGILLPGDRVRSVGQATVRYLDGEHVVPELVGD